MTVAYNEDKTYPPNGHQLRGLSCFVSLQERTWTQGFKQINKNTRGSFHRLRVFGLAVVNKHHNNICVVTITICKREKMGIKRMDRSQEAVENDDGE